MTISNEMYNPIHDIRDHMTRERAICGIDGHVEGDAFGVFFE